MKYYDRHLGDYGRDTGHLSLLEHGAYTVLLDRYYATEEGIPAAQAHRVARARTSQERAAVDAVLAEFFTLTDGIWRQARIESAIADYQDGDEEREAKRDNAKERQRRARARRAELFADLRKRGEVPAWDTPTNELVRILSRVTVTPVTCDDTATHTPIPNTQDKEQGASPTATPPADPKPKAKNGTVLPADWSLPDEWAAWARKERADLNPVAVAAQFADHWHSVPGKDGRKLDWLATWRKWVRGERVTPANSANAASSAVQSGKPKGPSETPLERAVAYARQQHSYGQIDAAERDRLISVATEKHRSQPCTT